MEERHLLIPTGSRAPFPGTPRRWMVPGQFYSGTGRPLKAETLPRWSVSSPLTPGQTWGGGPAIARWKHLLSVVGPSASLPHIKPATAAMKTCSPRPSEWVTQHRKSEVAKARSMAPIKRAALSEAGSLPDVSPQKVTGLITRHPRGGRAFRRPEKPTAFHRLRGKTQ